MATAVQSPGKALRLHKRHYLNEVVQERVDIRRRESKPVDISSISKISQFITRDGGKGSIIYIEPESSQFKVAGSLSQQGGALLQDSLSSFFSDSKAESAYLSALTAVDSFKEAEGEISKHELLQFIEESFMLSDEKRKQLQDKATVLDKSAVTLTCHVLSGEELITKDPAGSIDLYCQLGVLCEDGQEKGFMKQKKNIKEWQKEKLVESVGKTSVKSGSLEPEWDEVIQLSATKPRKEKLVLEIWNGDEINGGAGKNKSFVGRFFYPLQYIPTSGEKKTLLLHSHSGKSERGFVTVNLTIEQESCLLDFAELTCAMVNVSAKESGGYVRRWNGQLTPIAEKLLEEYASLNDIDDLYRACIRLSVLVKYHKLYAVNMAAICDLIRKIKHQVALIDINPPIAHEYWEKLLADLMELSEEMEAVMKNHLLMFDLESEDDVDRIKECLQTLCELYTFQPFTQRLPPGSGSLKEMLKKCIVVAVPKWFSLQEAQMQPQVQSEKGKLIAFRDLSQFCLQQCQVSLKILKPIFTKADVDYFSAFYTALDSHLGGEAESRMKEHSASSDSTTYEIYLIFRKIADLARQIEGAFNPLYDTRKTLLLPRYYKWFEEMVKNWITLAVEKCNNLTVQAINADSSIAITDQVKFSTSAVDVTGFLLQIGNFWKNLNWPEPIAAYGFASTMMEEVNKCAQFYVEEVAKRLTPEDVFDEQGRFRATEKLCIILNNMQHVRGELSHLEERLELESFYEWLDSEDESTLGNQCRAMVKKLLGSADDDIYNRMTKIMMEITEKLSPDIEKLVRGVVSESKTDVAKDDFEVISPLMDYLTDNLQVFADNLFPDVFEIILCNLWQLSLDCVLKCLKEVRIKKKGTNSSQLHQRSFTMLGALKDFYHSEGDGIREEDLRTDAYNRLFSQLDVLRLPTDGLILRFLSEFVEVQRRELEGDKEFGSLHASVCYLKEETMVEVNIIKGESLPSSSKNGWFVQLCLMPQSMFPYSTKIFKTGFQKNTKDPMFDETIKIPTNDEAMTTEGAVLFLSLFNHAVIGSDDFTAMCAIACKDIPHSTSDDTQTKNVILPFFRFIDLTYATAELEFRAEYGDAKASSFLKSNIKKALSFLPRPRSRSRSRSRSKGSVSYLEDSQAVQL